MCGKNRTNEVRQKNNNIKLLKLGFFPSFKINTRKSLLKLDVPPVFIIVDNDFLNVNRYRNLHNFQVVPLGLTIE